LKGAKMMNILLLGGFLGSGKTTFIKQLAEYLVSQRQRTVIIENEAGEVGIDDQLLAMEGFQVKEIMGGCICCTLTSELTMAVNQIGEQFQPDWLIVETTGIAKPGTIIATLNKYGQGIDHIFTVIIVDTGRWPELMEIMPELISSQVVEADLVIANKIDEIGPDGDLQKVISEITRVNPRAQAIPLSASIKIEDSLLKELCQSAAGDRQKNHA
jgi:G3E family GTPase